MNVPNWLQLHSNDSNNGDQLKFGGVSAVDFDTNGNVVIFHRGDRVWDARTFNANTFTRRDLGPIQQNTVMAFHPKTGKLLYECGKGL